MLLSNKLNEAGIMSFRDLAEAPRTRLQELLGRADDAEAIQAEAARRAEGEPR
jgi:predicted RecB family nuclease